MPKTPESGVPIKEVEEPDLDEFVGEILKPEDPLFEFEKNQALKRLAEREFLKLGFKQNDLVTIVLNPTDKLFLDKEMPTLAGLDLGVKSPTALKGEVAAVWAEESSSELPPVYYMRVLIFKPENRGFTPVLFTSEEVKAGKFGIKKI